MYHFKPPKIGWALAPILNPPLYPTIGMEKVSQRYLRFVHYTDDIAMLLCRCAGASGASFVKLGDNYYLFGASSPLMSCTGV
jgi:hypothetical protein